MIYESVRKFAAVGPFLLVRGTTHLVPHLAAYHIGFLTGAALAVCGALLATRINDRLAAPSMRQLPDAAADEVIVRDAVRRSVVG